MFRWIQTWWTVDRIRFTPGHCRLFQLTVGSRVLVRGRLWDVIEKRDTVVDDLVNVQFVLVEVDELEPCSATLRIGLTNDATRYPSVEWSEPGWGDTLLEEEIVQVNVRR
jgi:hypothetical protein